jgi:multiple sugar transport system substrate-binding protein
MASIVSRRDLLKTAGSTALAAGVAPGIFPGPARAQQKTLRVLKWVYPIAGYDDWFLAKYCKEWGEQNTTQVLVDRIGLGEVNSEAMAEV